MNTINLHSEFEAYPKLVVTLKTEPTMANTGPKQEFKPTKSLEPDSKAHELNMNEPEPGKSKSDSNKGTPSIPESLYSKENSGITQFR